MAIEILRRRPPSEHIVTDQALGLIKAFEGLHLKAYADPASPRGRQAALKPEKRVANWEKLPGDPWTIGWGHTKGVKEGDTCTLDQAITRLQEDANEAANIVRAAVQVPLTAGEFAALTSMAYNFGYIPPSLKACLNGGVTDKGKVMTPGSYGSALLQFPRNCRGKGIPMPGLYRRRLAESCVFSDLPWENACSSTVIKFDLDASGKEIDENNTTSLEDTLMRARLDTSKPPNTSDILKKPWSELIAKKAEPEAVPATGEADPAEKEAPQPNPPPLVSAPAIEKPALRGPAPATAGGIVIASPPTTPPVGGVIVTKPAPPPKLPDPPVPIGQQTGAVDAARKSEEWSASAKSMIYSRRFWGLLLVVVGRVWMLKTGSNAVLGAVSDPLVMEMFSGFMVMVIGEAVQHWGERKATRPLK